MFSDKCTGTDYTIVSYFAVAEQNGAHADKRIVADFTAVNNSIMSDGNVAADMDWSIAHYMHRNIILNVRVISDINRLQVATKYGSRPNSTVFTDSNITDNYSTGMNECRFSNFRSVL